jgi:hypothetical protein
MNRPSKTQHFDSEGRENLPQVIKNVKSYLRACAVPNEPQRWTLVFMTRQGEGPMMAYNNLSDFDLKIIAVTYPPRTVGLLDGQMVTAQIPDKVRRFFDGVGIRVITSRLPLDSIEGAESHNREMELIKNTLSIIGGSAPMAIQAVLQSVDHGAVEVGDRVIAITGDIALVVTASDSASFLTKKTGIQINEIICKPRIFSLTRPAFPLGPSPVEQLELDVSPNRIGS